MNLTSKSENTSNSGKWWERGGGGRGSEKNVGLFWNIKLIISKSYLICGTLLTYFFNKKNRNGVSVSSRSPPR